MRPLLATLVPPALLGVLVMLIFASRLLLHREVDRLVFGDEAAGFLLYFGFALFGILAIGWPSYLLFRRTGVANIWSAMLVGAIAGWLIPFALASSSVGITHAAYNELSNWIGPSRKEVLEEAQRTAFMLFLGAFTGASFWMILRWVPISTRPKAGES